MNAPISSPRQTSTSATTTTISHLSLPAAAAAAGASMASAPVGGTQGSADAFLRDLTLVAEAAKRAQVAVMLSATNLGRNARDRTWAWRVGVGGL
ncbi:uncharacterized protein DNG_00908 [Cephalotrichum gorgonifer]|uniref:Uncharacterized protein n=1 Tax=Cephalotrichum gorgonifer TaxID=2041049 RepID=A0AAE8MQ68_9PEZI|nr:uncharacterized protein DNG_00908 [Cephalotrichum gorgonifer]